MQNIDKWKPSKYRLLGNKLTPAASKYASSYRMASYIAEFYNDNIPNYVNGKLLDLGCGNVPMYEYYKQYAKEVVCVDWDSSLHDLKHLDMSCDLNSNLAIESNTFDTVICSDVIEHLSEPTRLLKEIYRVLKPGGYLLLNYPFIYGIHEAPHDHQRYTEFFIKKVASDIDIEIIQCYAYGNLLDMWEHATIRILKRIRFAKPLQFFFIGIIMPSIRTLLNRKMQHNNQHPYMYAFVLRKSK